MWCLQVTAKRVWRGLRARLGLRRTTGKGWINRRRAGAGLRRLRKEVHTCQYSDVHVMWELLSNTTAGKGAAATRPDRARAGRKAAAVAWSRLASYCCAI